VTPMTCAEVEELLPVVADGMLTHDDDPALFAHVARCPSCQESLARHDLIDLALRRAPPQQQRRWRMLPVAAGWAAAAAIVAGFLAAWPQTAAPSSGTPAAAPVAQAAEVWPVPGQPGRYLVVQPDGTTLVIDPRLGDQGTDEAHPPTRTVRW
jgi:hypothetical protein